MANNELVHSLKQRYSLFHNKVVVNKAGEVIEKPHYRHQYIKIPKNNPNTQLFKDLKGIASSFDSFFTKDTNLNICLPSTLPLFSYYELMLGPANDGQGVFFNSEAYYFINKCSFEIDDELGSLDVKLELSELNEDNFLFLYNQMEQYSATSPYWMQFSLNSYLHHSLYNKVNLYMEGWDDYFEFLFKASLAKKQLESIYQESGLIEVAQKKI